MAAFTKGRLMDLGQSGSECLYGCSESWVISNLLFQKSFNNLLELKYIWERRSPQATSHSYRRTDFVDGASLWIRLLCKHTEWPIKALMGRGTIWNIFYRASTHIFMHMYALELHWNIDAMFSTYIFYYGRQIHELNIPLVCLSILQCIQVWHDQTDE